MIDKNKELTASISLLNDKLHFEGNVDGNDPVSIDYVPPLGDNLGYTSLELFLLSLSSCVGSAILVLTRKMNKNIIAFNIKSSGIRKEDHPTGFKTIEMTANIKSADLTDAEMDKVLKMIEGICPVMSMINDKVEIKINYNISH